MPSDIDDYPITNSIVCPKEKRLAIFKSSYFSITFRVTTLEKNYPHLFFFFTSEQLRLILTNKSQQKW